MHPVLSLTFLRAMARKTRRSPALHFKLIADSSEKLQHKPDKYNFNTNTITNTTKTQCREYTNASEIKLDPMIKRAVSSDKIIRQISKPPFRCLARGAHLMRPLVSVGDKKSPRPRAWQFTTIISAPNNYPINLIRD